MKPLKLLIVFFSSASITLIFGIMLNVVFLGSGCCSKGDNACYKAWYGLEPHPTEAGLYTNPWERWRSRELRNPGDPGASIWEITPDPNKEK